MTTRLGELHTLLATSTVLVSTLDPSAVAAAIIGEVRRLVDMQAASVRVPDEQGFLRVLASVGRGPDYEQSPRLRPDDPASPAARALQEGRPVQLVAGDGRDFPALSYAEGFRSVLAIPITSPRAGAVVLLAHRTQPQPFTPNEVNLLLTFANYAALAWEHAVLYERSDERLREVARENERLYRGARRRSKLWPRSWLACKTAWCWPQRTARCFTPIAARERWPASARAIWRARPSRRCMPPSAPPPRTRTPTIGRARRPKSGDGAAWLVETHGPPGARPFRCACLTCRAIRATAIGRGLLLRDVTREQEIDRFKTGLLAAVGHEVRTPLAAIKGHASTLLQDDVAWSPVDQRHFLQTISAEADRLAQLVSNLLDLSRHEAGLLPLARAPVRLADPDRQRGRSPEPAAARAGAGSAPDLPPVPVDGPRIGDRVPEPAGQRASLRRRRRARHGPGARRGGAESRCSDDGPGLAPAELAHMFERFYRAPDGRRRRCRRVRAWAWRFASAFVEAHGGAIWAESGPTGTTIAFTLPCAARRAACGARGPRPREGLSGARARAPHAGGRGRDRPARFDQPQPARARLRGSGGDERPGSAGRSGSASGPTC